MNTIGSEVTAFEPIANLSSSEGSLGTGGVTLTMQSSDGSAAHGEAADLERDEAASSQKDDEFDDDENSTGDSDSEGEGVRRWLVNPEPKPAKISEKRRAANAAFDHWVEEHQIQLSETSAKGTGAKTLGMNIGLEGKTDERIIERAREYQMELFERAKEQNTIAVLDTGSGKTLIAALLMRWIIEKELAEIAEGKPKRIVFFLVDKVALVFQQHDVLTRNLDFPVEKLCGDLISSQQSKAYWGRIVEDNMAVVCTAEILNQCLHHSYLTMDQINLLIFDEAHHAKKDHPYARIIKDFYPRTGTAQRQPRILGMTASPVDAKSDPMKAAAELEGLLQSRIATTDDPMAIKNTVEESWIRYEPLFGSAQTRLHRDLWVHVGGHALFRKPFSSAAKMHGHLGPWCADHFWQLYFEDADLLSIEAKTERNLVKVANHQDSLDRRLEEVRKARGVVKAHTFEPLELSRKHLSSKVLVLLDTLRKYFERVASNYRCIVFVQERTTALLLADLVKQPSSEVRGLEAGILTGAGRSDSGPGKNTTIREQQQTIIRFRKGEINCIFATSVAEEGLDIPDCNIIIRFDLGATLIQYIQSRGRARQDNSIYIHMIEIGNRDHKKRAAENETQELVLRELCSALPSDRKLSGSNYDIEYFLRKERSQKQYTVPSTGARLTYKQSLVCLATFASSLSLESAASPSYFTVPALGGFQCEVMMPPGSPIKSAVGNVHSSKAVAKCAAAFEMCLQLLKGKYLDAHLQPTFRKRVHAMRNARLAVSSKKTSEYHMRSQPEIWSTLGEPAELFATVLTLSRPDAMRWPSTPLLLLTRKPLPRLASFPLFFGTRRSSGVQCTLVAASMKVNPVALTGLTMFTLKIFQDIFSKEYDPKDAISKFPYFLAPASKPHDFDFSTTRDVNEIIDWSTVENVKRHQRAEYSVDESDDFFHDKFVTDPWDGSRKFYLCGRRRDLKPRDPVPEGIVAPSHRAWKMSSITHDIINYSVSLWSKARAKYVWREDQAVVEAELLSVRRNLLDDSITDEDLMPKPCFLVLQPMDISPLPVRVVAMAYNFPAMIHRINSSLVALDACSMLGLAIPSNLALEAFTKDSENSDEHDTDKINFQRGMGENYERLEFLGDSVLKMTTTISVYTLLPENNEAESHTERMLLICNQNLFNNALEMKLQEYIRSKSFSRRTWYPTGLPLMRGKHAATNARHTLGDKSIADVCEALIGAAYLARRGQENPFDLAIQAVKVMVKDKKHYMSTFAEYFAAYKMPSWQQALPTAAQLEMVRKFGARAGYKFTHPSLLRSAFLHPSFASLAHESIPSYQRLEFLGDALHDMVCVDYLFAKFPTKDPQWLTEHKMAMVSNQFLACLAVALDFNKALIHLSSALQKDIQRYVDEITLALETAKEDAVREGKPESAYARDYWLQCPNPPKCLSDVVESYLGAVFIDSDFDYGSVQAFFDGYVQPYFDDMTIYDAFANKHPVSLLSNILQTRFHCLEWRLLVKELAPTTVADGILAWADGAGPPKVVCGIAVHGQTITHAVAASGRYAKVSAAKSALAELGAMSRDQFRLKHGCDCVSKEEHMNSRSGAGKAEMITPDHGTAI